MSSVFRLQERGWILLIGVFALAIGLFFGVTRWTYARVLPSLGSVRLHLTPQPVVAAFYQAQREGYFVAEGLDVHVTSYPTGRQALAAMVAEGGDFAVCADMPFVCGFGQGQPVTALASFGQVAQSIHLIGSRDRGITTELSSLVGHRLGLVRGTNAE